MRNNLRKKWSLLFLLFFCQYVGAGKIEDNMVDHLMLINKKIMDDPHIEKKSNIKLLFDSLFVKKSLATTDSAYVNLSYLIALSLYNAQKYDVTIKYLFETIPLLRKQLPKSTQTEKMLINLSFLLSTSYQAVGLWDQSIDLQYKLLSVAVYYGLDTEQAVIYNNLSSVMFRQKDYLRATQTLLKAIEINECKKDKEKLFVNYNNMSAALVKLEKYDRAIEYAFLAMHQLAETKSKEMAILVQRNIASIYLVINEYSLAEKYLREVEEFQVRHKLNSHLAVTYKIMGDLRSRQKQPSSAKMYYEKALSLSNTSMSDRAEILKNYAQLCREIGNINKTYALLEQYIQLKDSISNSEDKNKFLSIANMYLDEQHLRSEETNQLQSVKQALDLSRRVIIAMIFLLVVSVIFMSYLYRKKNRRLRRRINEQSGQIVSLSLDMMNKQEFTSSLADELVKLQQEFPPRSNDLSARIRSIVSTILRQNNDDKNSYFENMNANFYKALLNKYPSLTSKDLRLCVLLRLGLSTKEIADITCKEIRSVESARNRLRRKCDLSQEVDLFKFFNRFS